MTKQTLFLFLLGSFINQTFSQGFGIGEPSATSTLQVRGKGNTAATSALHVTDKDSISLFFIRDDGK